MAWQRFQPNRSPPPPPPPVEEPPALPPVPVEVPDELRLCEDHAGAGFHEVLETMHRVLRPERYFEIGTATGASLRCSGCASVAVDPQFVLDGDVVGTKPACFLYQETSDAFFAGRNLSSILGGPVDLAFLDGLHHFEFLLRDFLNTERHCRPDSLVVLHDCIPTDRFTARRAREDMELAPLLPEERRGWWAGDVWKTLVILKAYRADLTITCVNAPPTGLVVVTGLDPSGEKGRAIPMAEVVSEYRDITLAEFGVERFLDMAGVVGTGDFLVPLAWKASDRTGSRAG